MCEAHFPAVLAAEGVGGAFFSMRSSASEGRGSSSSFLAMDTHVLARPQHEGGIFTSLVQGTRGAVGLGLSGS